MAFIDKINPDVPEGRLLIMNGDYVLKDPEAEVSSIPLDKKWERLLKYTISQIESTSLRGISAKWKGNAKLEDLIK